MVVKDYIVAEAYPLHHKHGNFFFKKKKERNKPMDTQLAKPRKPVNQAAKTSRNPRKNKWAALRAQSTRHKETQHNKPRQVPTDAHTHTHTHTENMLS